MDIWFADSAATIHVSTNRKDFTSYHEYDNERSINMFSINLVKGVGEGNINVEVECGGKTTRIWLTNVMDVPEAEGKILSLKVLVQKGFKSLILADCVRISRDNQTYVEAMLGGELYEVKMKVLPLQENIMSAVKRDSPATDLYTWHQRLGHLGHTMLKKLADSGAVRGMEITNTQLTGMCRSCILGKMDEKPYEARSERDSWVFG